jgi:uncharacterized protein YecE (DUF72 family)
MPTRFHIGAQSLRGAITAYAKRFDLLEVRVGLVPTPKGKSSLAPSLATLRRWRKETPPAFSFCVVAGPNLSRLKPGPEFDIELDAAKAAIDVLQARCFVLRTPAEVTPAPVWRNRIGALLAQFPNDATRVVWEPGGVWELDTAIVAARAWRAVVAVDASREPVPPGPVAYVRLRGMGETHSYGPSALERMAASIGDRQDAFVVLETDTALRECKTLRTVAAGVAAQGGMGRLVRPHGGIVVGDDEQE